MALVAGTMRPTDEFRPFDDPAGSSPGDVTKLPAVYVVEDDPSVRRCIARLLLALQRPTHTFASAEEFLAKTPPGARGCLVLDMRLPGMSGLQLLEQLTRDGWRLPTVLISAEFTDCNREDARRLGAISILDKPFDKDHFLTTIRTALTDGPAD